MKVESDRKLTRRVLEDAIRITFVIDPKHASHITLAESLYVPNLPLNPSL